MWTNRHIVTALIVAPLLALLAWFAADWLMADQPRAAAPGAAYELVASGSCFHASGHCTLANGEFELALAVDSDGKLYLDASHALEVVRIAAGVDESFEAPRALLPVDGEGLSWQGMLADAPLDGSLRLIASAGGSSYFVETSLAFAGVPPPP